MDRDITRFAFIRTVLVLILLAKGCTSSVLKNRPTPNPVSNSEHNNNHIQIHNDHNDHHGQSVSAFNIMRPPSPAAINNGPNNNGDDINQEAMLSMGYFEYENVSYSFYNSQWYQGTNNNEKPNRNHQAAKKIRPNDENNCYGKIFHQNGKNVSKFQQQRWKTIIEDSVQILCYSEHLIVLGDKDKLAITMGVTNETQISLDSHNENYGSMNHHRDDDSNNDKSCHASKHASNRTHFILASLFTQCGTRESISKNKTTLYHNAILLRIHSIINNTNNSSSSVNVQNIDINSKKSSAAADFFAEFVDVFNKSNCSHRSSRPSLFILRLPFYCQISNDPRREKPAPESGNSNDGRSSSSAADIINNYDKNLHHHVTLDNDKEDHVMIRKIQSGSRLLTSGQDQTQIQVKNLHNNMVNANERFENLKQILDSGQSPSIVVDARRNPNVDARDLDNSDESSFLDGGSDSALWSQNYTFRLRLYDNETSNVAWLNTWRSVDVSKRLFAEIQLRQNKDATDDDLLATPKDCYFSLNSNPIAEEPRYMILTSGCPASKVDVRFFDQKSPNQTARFSLPVDFYFVDRMFMFFHCKVVACSKRGSREEENFEKCPSKTYCSLSASRLSTVPKPAYAYVSSGLLSPVNPARIPPQSSPTRNGGQPPIARVGKTFPSNTAQCPPCPVDDDDIAAPPGVGSYSTPPESAVASMNGGHQEEQRVVVTRGMDNVTVFAVAAASFVVGVLLMAGLCYVHRITEPKKYNAAKNFRKDAAWSSCVANGHHHHNNNNNGGEATVTTPMTTMSSSSCCNGTCGGHRTATCTTGTCSNSTCSGIGYHSSTGTTASSIIRFAKSPASLFSCCLPYGHGPNQGRSGGHHVTAESTDEREPMEKGCDQHQRNQCGKGVIILSENACCLNPDQCGDHHQLDQLILPKNLFGKSELLDY